MEHYKRQLAQNVAVIADTFESLEKIEDSGRTGTSNKWNKKYNQSSTLKKGS